MNIVHVCLSCFYIDGFSYQENELVRQHVSDGHDVLVIASTESKSPGGDLVYSAAKSYPGSDGAMVVRLAYRLWPHRVAAKLRMHAGVYDLLERFQPDAILFHGCCGWEVATVARYARAHPDVLFYIDSHEDWNNSARNVVSRRILHGLYYRACLARAWSVARKILCVSTETMDFVEHMYGVPRGHLELFPLGGHPVPDSEYGRRRAATRTELGVGANEILFVQSGKQTRRKKLLEALVAFKSHAAPNARLVIVGVLGADIREEAERLIGDDPKISFLGWKPAHELADILCAADVYLQPGTQSVTMQQSLCCRCAVIIDDAPSHAIYVNGNGWLVNSELPLERAIAEAGTADLPAMQDLSFRFAKENLDYAKLGQRVLRA
jgi:hypothetical protein